MVRFMSAAWIPSLLLSLTVSFQLTSGSDEILIADFEGTEYQGWEVEGTAFGSGPAAGTLPGQMAVDGHRGRSLVNSFHGGDASRGALTSPSFKIGRDRIQFLIGGGKNPGKTCVNLVVNDHVVRTATGLNDKPGGTERLDWQEWDVTEFKGRSARIKIVDEATGGWGHINVDHIVQTDRRLPGWLTDAARTFNVEKRWLNLPVKHGGPKRRVTWTAQGLPTREFEIELADAVPDFWVVMDLAPFKGGQAVLRVDKLREDSKALERIEQSDVKAGEPFYGEELRPQFHFTSKIGWNNDPNGLVYHDGEYHLFYQHNPYGWNWGNMHWGHAVSRDLVHWEELGEALYPDVLGTMFSGSAVVDHGNTAGFAKGDALPIVCVYTAAGGTSHASQGQRFTQCLAYSTDRGRTWTKYDGNPVLSHIAAENRDPKVFWHEPDRKWVMALYLDKNDFALFSSPDFKRWKRMSDVTLPGSSECPEFFEIPVSGDSKKTRWVFYGGNGLYLVGRFDGVTFTPGSGPHSLHHGNCFYASQTFNAIPAEDGRRILIAWGQVNFPGMRFNQMMDFPVELTLRETGDGLRLFVHPAREIERLRAKPFRHSAPSFEGDLPLAEVKAELLDVAAEFDLGKAAEVGLSVRGVPITYNAKTQELACLDKKGPLKPVDGKIRLRVLVDRGSIEIFANDGALYMPMGVILDKARQPLAIFAHGGKAPLVSVSAHPLRSIWP